MDRAWGVAVDATGQAYVTGQTSGNLNGVSGNGGVDAFLCRFSPTGSILGTTLSNDSDIGWGVSLESGSGVWVAGQNSNNANDGTLTLFNLTGQPILTRTLGSSGQDYYRSIATSSASVYVAGSASGSVNGEPYSGGGDTWLSRYDTTGTLLWTRVYGGLFPDIAATVAVDSAGRAYIAGTTGGAGVDGYFARYATDGTRELSVSVSSTSFDGATAIQIDASGNIYLLGATTGDLFGQTNAGAADIFLAKYDSAGTLLWGLLYGGANSDQGYELALDSHGRPWVAGHSTSDLPDHPNSGGRDGLLLHFDIDGTLLDTLTLATSGNDDIYGLAIGPNDELWASGFTTGALGKPNAGNEDAFVAHVIPEGSIGAMLLSGVVVLASRRRRT